VRVRVREEQRATVRETRRSRLRASPAPRAAEDRRAPHAVPAPAHTHTNTHTNAKRTAVKVLLLTASASPSEPRDGEGEGSRVHFRVRCGADRIGEPLERRVAGELLQALLELLGVAATSVHAWARGAERVRETPPDARVCRRAFGRVCCCARWRHNVTLCLLGGAAVRADSGATWHVRTS
jgi:hypothetical protein